MGYYLCNTGNALNLLYLSFLIYKVSVYHAYCS